MTTQATERRSGKVSATAGERPPIPHGEELLHDPLLNKGTAFTHAEREALGLRGLLPPHVNTLEEQVRRVMDNYRAKHTDLERYVHLVSLQDRNETLFYRVVVDHVEEMMPIIYTPTVGKACQQWGHLFRRPRGLYVSWLDRGRIAPLLRNWPNHDVRVIVVTDGERILGLGDQGAGGMGIPVGKLSLYTACAGIDPAWTLPVMLDVGTENEGYLRDPLYMGLRQRRVRGPEYDAFVAEFVEAVQQVFPRALVQFEDFANLNAFRLLDQWRDRVATFNDDIQGTAAVTLAGLYSSMRLTGGKLADQRVLFLGAGEAGVGIGDLVASAMVEEGLSLDEARRRLWFVDSQGLVVKSRTDLAHHKLRFAHEAPACRDFHEAIEAVRPTAIIGVSTVPRSFDERVVRTMARLNERPIVFALSNPTSKSECSAEDAYRWSDGRAIFASGSPFPPVVLDGKTYVPGQGNNAYIFPGVGLGVVASQSRRVTDRMFSAAARTLASMVLSSDLELGRVYPALTRIREVSAHIGAAVARIAFDEGFARVPRPDDVLGLVEATMWEPRYRDYV
jgi:malate dehydrogenase (oxaloacetate-decarboxylating)(NADP+)